jgi:hypothetical protein
LLISALSVFFGNKILDTMNNISLFTMPEPEISAIKKIFSDIISSWPNSSIYKDLTKDLQEKTLYSESLDDFQKEVEGIDGLFINPETSPQMTMYKENAFKGQKISLWAF